MLFGCIMQHYFPDLISHPGIFAVAGMAGIFASTVRAPLTGMVLAVEMTSNYELILPLIITTVTASVFTALLGNEPIYTTLLKRTLAKTK
jgi:CIC family chloride channel protein